MDGIGLKVWTHELDYVLDWIRVNHELLSNTLRNGFWSKLKQRVHKSNLVQQSNAVHIIHFAELLIIPKHHLTPLFLYLSNVVFISYKWDFSMFYLQWPINSCQLFPSCDIQHYWTIWALVLGYDTWRTLAC